MKKLILFLMLLTIPLFAQSYTFPTPLRLSGTSLIPAGQWSLLPYSNGVGNLGSNAIRWNYIYGDSSVVNYIIATTSSLGAMTGTSLSLTDGTDTYKMLVSSDKWTLQNDAGSPATLAQMDSVGRFSIGASTGTYSFENTSSVGASSTANASNFKYGITTGFYGVTNGFAGNIALAYYGGDAKWFYLLNVAPQAINTGPKLEFATNLDNTTLASGLGTPLAEVGMRKTSGTANDADGYLFFTTRTNAVALTERMRITGDGEVYINSTTDAGDYKLQVAGGMLGTLGAAEKLLLDGSTTGHTDTAGLLDINMSPTAAATGTVMADLALTSPSAGFGATTHYGINLSFTGDSDDNASSIVQLIQMGFTPNSSPATVYGLYGNDSDLDYFIFEDGGAPSRFDGNVTFNAGIFPRYLSGALTDGAPTDAEIDAVTGSTPAGLGVGYMFLIKDTDGSGLIYEVISDGTAWQYKVLTIAL